MSNLGMESEIIERLEAALEASEARVRELTEALERIGDELAVILPANPQSMRDEYVRRAYDIARAAVSNREENE